ncbi:TatD family hydrolase [Candidatus Daviesbacteria bacterium]|nr:TatD family hydrolase [Candidatus Daviesbacteria bacterium]
MITDTHAHLFWDSFKKDFDDVIKRALENKVTTIINVGTDLETSQEALDQVQGELSNFPELSTYSTIGIHPHEAIKYLGDKRYRIRNKLEKDIEILEQIYKSNPKKVIAVGECGLDYFFVPEYIPPSLSIEQIKHLQGKLFLAQVKLAHKLNLPLLVHCRKAWDDIWEYLDNLSGIMHCFSGDLESAKKAINMGFLISFAATLTYPKNENLREVAQKIPLDKIVLETDCPFLPPQSKRGQRNEPSSVLEIAKLVANLKGITIDKVATQTTINFKNLVKV